jgi:hypothetical protein
MQVKSLWLCDSDFGITAVDGITIGITCIIIIIIIIIIIVTCIIIIIIIITTTTIYMA